MIELTTLGTITCYAIIIAMVGVLIKTFSYPLSNFFRALNPLVHYRLWQNLNTKTEDLNMDIFMLKGEIKDLKSEINRLKNNKAKKT